MSEDINVGAITEALNNKADRDLVNITTNSSNKLENIYKNADITVGTLPSSNTFNSVKFIDSQNNTIARLQLEYIELDDVSRSGAVLIANNNLSSDTQAYFGVYARNNGNNEVIADAQTKATLTSYAFPSLTKRTAITVGASGTRYNAPADGFIWLVADCGTNTSYMNIRQAMWIDQRVYQLSYKSVYIMAPVTKGTYCIDYGNITFTQAYFIYAQGEA